MEKIVNTYELDINDRAFLAIKNGTKKIEIRVTTDENRINYGNIKENDYLILKNSTNEILKCRVIENKWYKNSKELLMLEGTRFTLSSTDDLEEGIKSISSHTNYEEGIKKNGVHAIKIEPIIDSHEMKLEEEYFNYIKKGTKRIEIRLFDEKRRKIKIGDKIIFYKLPDTKEKIEVKVNALLNYDNFSNLINDFSMELLCDKSMSKEKLISILNKFYSDDEQKKYGVLGIKIDLL